MPITANNTFKLDTLDKVKYDNVGTEIRVKPYITIENGNISILLILEIYAGIELLKTKTYNLTSAQLQDDEPQIVNRVNAVMTALEKFIEKDLEAINTGVQFTRI